MRKLPIKFIEKSASAENKKCRYFGGIDWSLYRTKRLCARDRILSLCLKVTQVTSGVMLWWWEQWEVQSNLMVDIEDDRPLVLVLWLSPSSCSINVAEPCVATACTRATTLVTVTTTTATTTLPTGAAAAASTITGDTAADSRTDWLSSWHPLISLNDSSNGTGPPTAWFSLA